jgi:hypothetical protein
MKRISLFALLSLIIFSITACSEKNTQLSILINEKSNCLTELSQENAEKNSAFSYHATESGLTINKYNEIYPCDSEIQISAEIKDNVIAITEKADAQTNCTCPKNLTYTIENIPSGSYKISINGKIIGNILIY